MNRIFTKIILLAISCSVSSCTTFHWHVTKKDKKKRERNDSLRSAAIHTILPQPDFDTVAAKPATNNTSVANDLIAQLQPVWNANLDYKTFSGKAKIHFSGPDNDKTFTAHFRVRKDSVIWVNVTFDAIPVARLFITRDSFYLLNNIDQEITRIPLAQAAKVLPTKVDFSSLQNLITGEAVRKGPITDASSSGDSLVMQVEDSSYIQHVVFNKTDSTIRIEQVRTRDMKGPKAVLTYVSYETVKGRKVSTYRTLNVQKGIEDYVLDMNFSKIDFDEALDFPFTIPSSYTEKK